MVPHLHPGSAAEASWHRAGLSYDDAREPEGLERTVLYPDHLVVECAQTAGPRRAGDEPGVPDRLPGLARGPAARDGLVALSRPPRRPGRSQRRHPGLRAQRLPLRLARRPDPGPARAGSPSATARSGCCCSPSRPARCSRCPSAGALIQRWWAGAVVRVGVRRPPPSGLLLAAWAPAPLGPRAGLRGRAVRYGIGTGVWDVAMNVEGAEVERGLGRSIMPRFHAAWSVGSIAGAGDRRPDGRACTCPLPLHLGLVGAPRRAAGRCAGPVRSCPAEEESGRAVVGRQRLAGAADAGASA